MVARIRKDDTVIVLAGKDKGRSGKVLKVLTKEERVVVEGVNMIKRHTKPDVAHPQGGVISKEAAIHVSNVAYVHKGKPTKLGYRVESDGTKVRIARRTGEVIS